MLHTRVIRYYAYVPEAQDPSILRGESLNFFHDVTLSIQRLGIGGQKQPDPTDRLGLIRLFYEQLQELGQDYARQGTRTLLLIDGLDHIEREQNPERSLLADLPLPGAIPSGVYVVIGSQTVELTQLPLAIRQALVQDDRRIEVGKLALADVQMITETILPALGSDMGRQIYELSDGHPLALVYLLNSLVQAPSPDSYSTLLNNSLPYRGNIEEQYEAHWRQMENDFELGHLMALLARMRGPIPIQWVAQWAEDRLLLKLRNLFAQYFSSDNQDRWEFFHNSFRIYLEKQTAAPLPGRDKDERDRSYHSELARSYGQAALPWKWETLYHFYRAGDLNQVVGTAQYAWFREQAEALRPIDAIETDVRLAIKAAGELIDTVAIVRLTLVAASLEQRNRALEDTSLPHWLIEAGQLGLAADYIRDGNRLRVSDEKALKVSISLHNAGWKKEALRVFELAEPLEYLSGRLIEDRHRPARELSQLLAAWVESASLLRTPAEAIASVRRIAVTPSFQDKEKDSTQVSRQLQNWLLAEGALACGRRNDWEGWQVFLEALNEPEDRRRHLLTLLQTADYCFGVQQPERARQLLLQFLPLSGQMTAATNRQQKENYLIVAWLALQLSIDNAQVVAQEWLDRVGPIPLADQEVTNQGVTKLYWLQYDYARLRSVWMRRSPWSCF